MKSISVLLVAVFLVVAVAVSGSRAQPLTQATSDAYRSCFVGRVDRHPPIVLDRCRPADRIVVAQTEFEASRDAMGQMEAVGGIGAGGDVAGGEKWTEVLKAVLQALVNVLNVINVLQVIGGGALPQGTEVASVDTLFDPVR